MRASALAVIVFTAFSTQACTVALPVTLGVRADRHNARATKAATRTGEPARLQSVGPRIVGGLVGGAAIDLLLGLIIAVNAPTFDPA